jgi:hypothetical protein
MNNSSDTTLDLKKIHGVIGTINTPENISKTIEDIKSTTFEDILQSLETASRPKAESDVSKIKERLLAAVITAGEDPQRWKLLMLTILRKRYHYKSPEAKSILREIRDKKEQAQKQDQDTSGHGERMIFYVLFICLYYLSKTKAQDGIPMFINNMSTKACHCLGQLVIAAGGTRDVCTLLEHLVYESLVSNGTVAIQKEKGKKRAVSAAVIQYILSKNDGSIPTILNELVKAAADLLDQDFLLIASIQNKEQVEGRGSGIQLQSTINTFIPHHDRGSNERKLTQSLAELMIWSETKHSQTDSKFVQATSDIQNLSSSLTSSDPEMDDKIVSSLHVAQTSIRRFRKKLNESSRKQGFALCSSFHMEPSSVTLSMVKRGREGDVLTLERLAKKKRDERVMKLISNRSADPSKAIPIHSVRQFCNNWTPLEAATKSDDELTALQLKIQEATVKATLKLLKSKIPETTTQKKVLLASLDGKVDSDCAAILVAAAFNFDCQCDGEVKDNTENMKREVTLFIGDKTCDVSTLANVLSLLDEVFAREKNNVTESTPATTKDVQNLIERHLEANSNLLLFTSTDIKIEQRVLTKLQLDGSTIHCHVMDDFIYRMKREKAKVGDITITLAWDNECDLDLHAHCPNGDHIYYGEKEGGGSPGGGYLDVDMNVNGESKEPVENIFFGDAEKGIQAAKGKYKVVVENFGYHGKTIQRGEPVPWRLRVAMNGEIHNYSGECKGTGDSSNVTAVEFEYEGRKAPPPEEVGSALTSSNLVSITSSTGDTIDSLSGLLSVGEEHKELTNIQTLVNDGGTSTEAPSASNGNATRPLMADTKSFDITNRDRLYLKLSKLPKLFHLHVNQCFEGGATLMEYTASELAKRLISDGIAVEELKKAGYQEDIVNIVKEKMRTLGI